MLRLPKPLILCLPHVHVDRKRRLEYSAEHMIFRAGCDSRPVVKVHEPCAMCVWRKCAIYDVHGVDSVKFRDRQYSLDGRRERSRLCGRHVALSMYSKKALGLYASELFY